MAEVKWIKLTTDMFDNRKIRHLRKMPEGNNIVLIWVMLLTMAGRCNAGGMIFLTETIPYTPKMLADELDFEENTVRLALDALSKMGMVVCDADYFAIANWNEYQNIEGLDKLREQNRIRQANFKARKRIEAGNVTDNVTGNVTVTQGNATDIDIEEDKELDSSYKKKKSRFAPPTPDEVSEYCREKGYGINAERFCDFYASKNWMVGKTKMSDWKAAVRNWARGQDKVQKPKTDCVHDRDACLEDMARYIKR